MSDDLTQGAEVQPVGEAMPDAQQAAPETTEPSATEQPELTPEQEVEAEAAKAAETERKKQERVEKRINREVARRGEAERRVQELEQRLAQFEKPQPTGNAEPTIDQFDSFDEYRAALAEYTRKQIASEYEARATQQTVAQQAQAVQTHLDKFAEAHPDFDDAIGAVESAFGGQLPQQVARTLLQMPDKAPQALYELGTNEDLLDRFTSMSPEMQLIEIGMMLAKPAAPKVAPVSKAPPPITPIKANAPARRDRTKMSDEEYLASRGIR